MTRPDRPLTGRSHLRFAAAAVALCAVAALSGPAPAAAQPEPDPAPVAEVARSGRLAGTSRIGTAVQIAGRAFPDVAARVYLARADVFADALAAGSLTDGPVLLVPACGDAPPEVLGEVDRLDPGEVVALGGTAAVCDSLLDDVAGGRRSSRLAGDSRFATAAQVAATAFPGGAAEVYLARAVDSPDAAAAGSLNDGPILLVPSDGEVPADVLDAVDRLDPGRVVALGGTAAVSEQILAKTADGRPTGRVSGDDRFATAAAVSGYEFPVGADAVYLARADVFADAVAAGSLTDGPVLLVPSCGELPAPVAAELGRLEPGEVVALGGASAVCDALLADAAATAGAGAVDAVPDTTVVLDDADGALESYDADGTIVLDADDPAAQAVEAGDVLVSGPADAAPSGLLRRAVTVDRDGGQVIVATEAAALTDAVNSGSVAAALPLSPDEVMETEILVDGVTVEPVELDAPSKLDAAGPSTGFRVTIPETSFGPAEVRGAIDVRLELHVDLGVAFAPRRGAYLDRFEFAVQARQTSDLEVLVGADGTASGSRDLYRQKFNPTTLLIAGVPVVIVPEVRVAVGADGAVHAGLTAAVEQTASYTAGANYDDGDGWQPISEQQLDFDVQPPVLTAAAEVTGWASVRLDTHIYDLAGPHVTARAHLRADLVDGRDPLWAVHTGLRATAGIDADLPVLGRIAGWEDTVLNIEHQLASGGERSAGQVACGAAGLAAAVEGAGYGAPEEVLDVRCVGEFATGIVIDPITGDTDALTLFRLEDGSWRYVSDIWPTCTERLAELGVTDTALAAELVPGIQSCEPSEPTSACPTSPWICFDQLTADIDGDGEPDAVAMSYDPTGEDEDGAVPVRLTARAGEATSLVDLERNYLHDDVANPVDTALMGAKALNDAPGGEVLILTSFGDIGHYALTTWSGGGLGEVTDRDTGQPVGFGAGEVPDMYLFGFSCGDHDASSPGREVRDWSASLNDDGSWAVTTIVWRWDGAQLYGDAGTDFTSAERPDALGYGDDCVDPA